LTNCHTKKEVLNNLSLIKNKKKNKLVEGGKKKKRGDFVNKEDFEIVSK